MAEVEQHDAQVLTGVTTKGKTAITVSTLTRVAGTTLDHFGTTFLDLGEIAVLEFQIDDDEDNADGPIVEGAKVKFKSEDRGEWEIPEDDAKILYQYLLSNIR
jgi:hypothetical protein